MLEKNIPTILILFGITGDLASKKIIPAIFHLYQKGNLPKLFQVVGVSRRDFVEKEFMKHIEHVIRDHVDAKVTPRDLAKFTKFFRFQQADYTCKDGYSTLSQSLGLIDRKWKICSNKLFYLSVPPSGYNSIFHNLAKSGLTKPCSDKEGWTRVIVEKPFGKDCHTASALDMELGQLFKEEQIYRIDHYLGKEMLQNILTFRFNNNLFENAWDSKSIEKIEVKFLEKIGVETRGSFYDGVGAFRDIGQNHLLQMLALVTMEYPGYLTQEEVRKKRVDIFKKMKTMKPQEVKENTVRGQYRGYRDIQGVAKTSQTETYFKIKTEIQSSRWKGVPIYLEGGKSMEKEEKEIIVTFKHSKKCTCPPGTEKHYKNKISFHLTPTEGIKIDFWSKQPGNTVEVAPQSFEFCYSCLDVKSRFVEAYEKLLQDCFEGNQMLFVSTNEIKAMWKFADPIVAAWENKEVPLQKYDKKNETRQAIKACRGERNKQKNTQT